MITGTIAVVGVACRYPGSATPQELWQNVLAQRRQFRRFPRQRLPTDDYTSTDPHAEDRAALRQAAFMDGWSFDRVAWRVPRRTFEATDPAHWLALELADEAVANVSNAREDARGAVYVGNTLTGEFTRSRSLRLRWPYVARTLCRVLEERGVAATEQHELLARFGAAFKAPFPATSEDTLAGSLSNTIAGRICGHLDLGGGGYTVDGACASSLLAVATACERLAAGEVDVALAGGVDISLDPFEVVGFAKAGALAKGELRIYDGRASGMVPGEGAGFVALKRLEDARRDGDEVLAELRGWGISSDGRGAITAPQSEGQRRALATAWQRAGLQPGELDFVEGHGTGTTLGDPVELRGIASARTSLGDDVGTTGVTSLKSIVGHTKAAAGIGALLKTVIAVNQRVLPPTAGCEEPHPAFLGDALGLYPIRRGLRRPETARLHAGVSAMGFGGINAHVVVASADPPHDAFRPAVPVEMLLSSARRAEVMVVAGDSAEARLQALHTLRLRCDGMSEGELVDLSRASWETARGPWRAAVVARTPDELLDRVDGLVEALRLGTPVPPGTFAGHHHEPAPVGVVFPGQGSQRAGAARMRLDAEPELVQATLAAVGTEERTVLAAALTPAPDVVDPAPLTASLQPTRLAQPAITAASLAWWRWLSRAGLKPVRIAGHSLGELAALHACGALSQDETVAVAALRGRAMDGDGEDGMLSLPMDAADTRALLEGAGLGPDPAQHDRYAVVANENHPRQTVVAGTRVALARLAEQATLQDIEVRELPVSRAFHSACVADAAKILSTHSEIPEQVQVGPGFVSSVDGAEHAGPLALRMWLGRQATAPVRFTAVVDALRGCELVVEVGPGRVLSGLFRHAGGPRCLPIESRPGVDEDACAVLGALFTLGHDLAPEVLFEGRWTRPFVPASDRLFLVNPCETYADVDSATPRALPELPAPAPTSDDPLAVLYARVEEVTGFPVATLRPEHRLLDDLNLDSIKTAELLATFARDLGVSPAAAAQHAGGSLSELAAAVAEAPLVDERSTEESWVAPFQWRKTPSPTPPMGDHPWHDDAVVLHGAISGDALEHCVTSLGGTLAHTGAHHLVLLPAEAPAPGALLPMLADLAATLPHHGTVLVLDAGPERGVARCDDPAAWFASLHLERPGLRVRYAEVGADPDGWQAATDELRDDAAFRHVSLRGPRSTFEARYTQPRAEGTHQPGVCLVTGGGKGITAACVLALARRAGGRYALVGRSAPGDEVRATLAALSELGVEAVYLRGDLADPTAVRRLVGEARAQLGPITWLVHGAGLNVPRRVEDATTAEATAEVAPKLFGLQHLLHALDDDPVERVVALTSIIGVTGMPGNAWYAYANASVARLLARWQSQRDGTSALSLAYSVWAEVGMGVRLGSVDHLSAHGVAALPAGPAAEAFARWATSDSEPCAQVVLTGRVSGDFLDTWRQPTPTLQGRFVGTPHRLTPEVELVTDVLLHPDTDPYLLDHDYEGSLLFPTVFGLEAMAQGARVLLGAVPRAVNDLRLERPIVVHPTDGQTLRLTVVRTGPDAVHCTLSVASSGFEVPHFSATLHRDAAALPLHAPTPGPALDLDPDEALYGSVLFQGPLFHSLRAVHELQGRDTTVRLSEGLTSGEGWHRDRDQLALGCPYRRDALLQAGQLLITPRVGLPVHVDRWVLDPSAGPRHAHVHIHTDTDHTVTADVVAARGDEVTEALTGYRIRVLHTDDQLPTPAQLRGDGPPPETAVPTAPDVSAAPDPSGGLYAISHHDRGARGETVFRFRFPLSFSAVGLPSGSASVGELAHWLGKTREIGIRPSGVYAAAARHVASGEAAWVTKESELRQVGPVRATDSIEVECWNERMYGPEEASLEMLYRWYRVDADGRREPVAEASQTTTWARVIEHGVVRPAPYPDDMGPWLRGTLPRRAPGARKLEWASPHRLGATLWESPEGPDAGLVLSTEDFRTSSRHSNMVGNVYWANYVDWMVETRDLWLGEHVPFAAAELHGMRTQVQHLREAMPGDRVRMTMRLLARHEHGLRLAFDAARVEADGTERKLARVFHDAVCLVPIDGDWRPAPLHHPGLPPATEPTLQPALGGRHPLPQRHTDLRGGRPHR